ncbi:Pkinase-domain-containing protein [Macrolepiota fuliginosa MF-IS2]|uniref:Pkinase-domain-containing protein n=1 Tax=Macrolepiota fuliginosa MF-IS2 TaxID=1400762 RepID=A0A9P6C7R5_9AGAR|nr:Pkinase-domain-containing protein [Macrolepiota fuliginosa MF-IS2]
MTIRKQPSLESTWNRAPSRQNRSSNVPPEGRTMSLLPYRPTPSPRPASRLAASGPLPTIAQGSHHSFQSFLPSQTKATFQWMRGELLGQGSYGRVYMALNVNTGELMAVKQVELPREDHKPQHQDALRFLAFESRTLRDLDHPNIVQYLGYEDSAEALSVFLEYVPGGTIATLLSKHGRFREEVTKSFTRQILEGLEYLHSRGIIHRDLKPDNILVEPIGVCKISDFGISKMVEDIHSPRAHTLMRGTVNYMAPEILGSKEKGYDGKIDIWSVGCMVMEMWTGEKPWASDENFMAIMLKLRETQSPPPLPAQLQKDLSPSAHNFRDSCFHINPVQRPSPAELKQHPYLRLPQTWTFIEGEISHPSRERRIGKGGRKQREPQDDGATYRPRKHMTENQDATLRAQDFADDGSTTVVHNSRQPILRGPSPPIVYIQPLKPKPSPAPSPSPIELQEQDNATSESSHTSNSRRSGKRKGKYQYRVANPGAEEPSTSYDYVPPPLPPTSQPYSAHLGASSRYNLDYIPEPSPPARTRSSSTPHFPPTPGPSSSSSGYPSHNHSSSKSSSSSSSSLLQSSSGTEDSATWKRPPVSAPLHHGRASSSSSNAKYEHGSSSAGHLPAPQLRTPPPPTVPPPLPPTRIPPPPPSMPPPLPPSPSPHFQSSSSTSSTSGREKSTTSQQRGNRPNTDVIVRHLGVYFPDHDLDQPVVVPAASVDDLTESFNPALTEADNNHHMSRHESLPSNLNNTPAISNASPSPSRLSRLRQSNFNPLSSRRGDRAYQLNPQGAGPSITTGASTSANPALGASPDPLGAPGNSGRLAYAKSIRRIAEEQASKRSSNPGAHRRTLWDIKMEELKTLPPLPGANQPQPSDHD